MLVIVYSVIARYIFDDPPVWSYDLSRELFGVFIVCGGAYVAMKGKLLNVDILWKRFSPRTGAIINLVTYLFGLIFLGALVWKATPQAILSVKVLEKSTDLTLYLFPLRILFVIGSFLFLIQLIMFYNQTIKIAIGKRQKNESA